MSLTKLLYVTSLVPAGPLSLRRADLVLGRRPDAEVTVVDEDRTIEMREGSFADDFGPHEVHIYRVAPLDD